jgi:hypothetical protein
MNAPNASAYQLYSEKTVDSNLADCIRILERVE